MARRFDDDTASTSSDCVLNCSTTVDLHEIPSMEIILEEDIVIVNKCLQKCKFVNFECSISWRDCKLSGDVMLQLSPNLFKPFPINYRREKKSINTTKRIGSHPFFARFNKPIV
ncbi:hypothetical protein CDAR_412451 [Caerostris darwini]|uniref:Uncharacterized protein n=1 Tax=Caerostris darwini TaxID=1538125 RepID=A0AAV4WTZ0_9ARAC|nr:hypothetical protein CDAR_412451 [Caerostris darwini]